MYLVPLLKCNYYGPGASEEKSYENMCGRRMCDTEKMVGWLTETKSQKGLPLETKNTQIHEIGDLVWLSLFICNIVVCEAAYAPPPPPLPHSPRRRLDHYTLYHTIFKSFLFVNILYTLQVFENKAPNEVVNPKEKQKALAWKIKII